MKLFTATAIAVVAAFAAAPALAQPSYTPPSATQTPQIPSQAQTQAETQQQVTDAPVDPSKIKVSKGAAPALRALQQAVIANDFANIPARLAAAKAASTTAEDRYVVGQLQLKAALAAKDNAAAAAAVDAIATSGLVTGTQVADLYSAVGVNFYNAKQYDQATALFQKSASLNPRSAEPLKLLAEAQNIQGRPAEGAATLAKALQLSAAAGQKPPEELYKRALSMAYDAKSPVTVELARQWIAAYPSPDSWRNAIAIYRNLSQQDVEGTLNLLRLMRAAGALTSTADYSLYATAAADQSNFNEAQAVIDEGLANKRIDPSNSIIRDTIAGLKTKPKATEADLQAAAKTAQSALALIRIGDRYYGMGQYMKAAEVYRQALARPGVDKDIANLHLGMALARAGDKAGATAAFNAVGGSRADVAKFWLLYVQRQG